MILVQAAETTTSDESNLQDETALSLLNQTPHHLYRRKGRQHRIRGRGILKKALALSPYMRGIKAVKFMVRHGKKNKKLKRQKRSRRQEEAVAGDEQQVQ